MNRDMVRGGVRNVRGRAKSALGGARGDLAQQGEGLVDQVAGGARYAYGKAHEHAEDLIEDGTQLWDQAVDQGRSGIRQVQRQAEAHPGRAVAVVAGLAFLLGWLLRPTRS